MGRKLHNAKKRLEKSQKSDTSSKRTRVGKEKKFDEDYKKMKEAGKGKVNEGEQADKEYIEVSEEEEEIKTYKRKKVAGKRKIDENINSSEDEETIEDVTTSSKNTKKYQTLRPRATSVPLFEVMRCLSPERKKVIIEMGFGELIDFPIGKIPTKLAFFVINSLQTDTMSLKLPTGDITILPTTVKEIFGIPMGERMLERQEGERDSDDPFFEEWNSQFPAKLKKITTNSLSQVMVETTNADYMFKMNFLMLFANTMGSCDNSSELKYTVLKNVLQNDNVQDIDWCTYIWECAKYSKTEWKKSIKNKEVVYYGPITFLMVNPQLLSNYTTSNNLSQVTIYVFITHIFYETVGVSTLHKDCWYGGEA